MLLPIKLRFGGVAKQALNHDICMHVPMKVGRYIYIVLRLWGINRTPPSNPTEEILAVQSARLTERERHT